MHSDKCRLLFLKKISLLVVTAEGSRDASKVYNSHLGICLEANVLYIFYCEYIAA